MSVIPYPGSPESEMRLKIQREREKQQKERVLSVRAAAENNKPITRGDAIELAQTIDKLIVAADQKITHRDIREATKLHLERLRVDHKLSPREAKEKAPQNLICKSQPYVRVLDTLAGKLGRAPDEVIFEAFRNISFGQTALVSADEPAAELQTTLESASDPAAEFSWLIHKMSRYIVTSQQLDDYFRQASIIPERYDPIRRDSFPDVDQGGYFKEGRENTSDMCMMRPSFPTVPLVRVHRETFSGPLLVEKKPVAPPDYTAAEAEAMIGTSQPSLGPTDTLDCEVALFTDIRLVIGPLKRADDLGPLFETRFYLELKTEGQLRPLTSFALFVLIGLPDGDPSDGSVLARFDEGWRRITKFVGVESGVRFAPLIGTSGAATASGECSPSGFVDGGGTDTMIRGFQPRPEGEMWGNGAHWAVCWHPVNASTVKQVVTLLSPYTSKWEWLLRERVGPEAGHEELLFFGEDCQEFEQALYTGAIETELAADCDRLKTRLADCIKEFKTKRERELQTLLARWRSPSAN